jgi:hypothetical protein
MKNILITLNSGRYYGIAAAAGKIGAFTGTYLFKVIQDAAAPKDKILDHKVKRGRNPVLIASVFAFVSACMAYFLLPECGQDSIEEEDQRFKQYLVDNGYDTSSMGLAAATAEVTEVKEV